LNPGTHLSGAHRQREASMTAHRRPVPASTPAPDFSPEDILALRRQSPDYVPPPPAPVSWEDFLAWLDEDTHAEWVDGEIIEMPPVVDDHQFILGFIYRLMMELVDEHQLGLVYLAPFKMHLPSRRTGREPDLAFLKAENATRAHPTYLDGPADLVVEIVSPESVTRDYETKRAEYEAASIPEYWIVDPIRQAARFYLLGDDGQYRLGTVDVDGVYASPIVTGLRLRVSWLWRRPLPTIKAALADLPPQ
jgi:Uma2 family endonuclease